MKTEHFAVIGFLKIKCITFMYVHFLISINNCVLFTDFYLVINQITFTLKKGIDPLIASTLNILPLYTYAFLP